MSSLFERFVPIAIRGRVLGSLLPLVTWLKAPKDLPPVKRPADAKLLAARVVLDMQPVSGERPRLNLLSGDATKAKAVILYFHSGGFCIRAPPEEFLKNIGNALGPDVLVYSGEYRLAPEYRFPASHEDADKLLAEVVSLHPQLPIILGGASAGGHLAGYAASHATSQNTASNLKGVYLNCPSVSPNRDTPSRTEFATGRFLTVETANLFQDCYGEFPDLNDMPAPCCPVLMHSAVEDILFSEGMGLTWPTCRKRLFPTALHDFLHSTKPLCGASAVTAVEEFVHFAKEVIPLD